MLPHDSSVLIALSLMVVTVIVLATYTSRRFTRPRVAWNLRFLIVPGFGCVDGEERFVPAHELMRLYDVHPRNCVVFDERFPFATQDLRAYVPLYARLDGIYRAELAFHESGVYIDRDALREAYA